MVAALEDRELDLLVGWRKNRQDGLFLRKIPFLERQSADRQDHRRATARLWLQR